jgi:AcrR family transcriptional regulator
MLPMAERSAYHHGDLRRALLQAAAAEIHEVGPSAISLRSIARRAGVSHAAPAHHFGDRAGLLAAVAAEGFRRMNESMVAAATDSPEPLLAIGRAYVAFARTNPGEFAVMFRPELLGSDPDLEVHGAAAHQRLVEAIAVTPGATCNGEDPSVTAARLWSLVHGLATLVITGSLPADDDLIDQVLRG